MYFSLGVKESRRDLFDFERELTLLVKELKDPLTRMVVIKGIRRTGKSSLLRVGLAESKLPNLLIDIRTLEPLSTSEVYELFAASLSKLVEKHRSLVSALKQVSGISIAGVKVDFASRRKSVLIEVLEKIEQWGKREDKPVVLAVDEAQRMRSIPGFGELLAHVYDYLSGIKLVLTGSEVGLLDRLLGERDAKAPLFGRPFYSIELGGFPQEKAAEFLRAGFEQQGLRVPDDEIEEAVGMFDGIVGWLTSYGYHRLKYGHRKAIDLTVKKGAELVRAELASFLEPRAQAKARYRAILEVLITPQTWTGIKRRMEAKFGRVSNKQLSHYLAELVDYGFVKKTENRYSLADPLIEQALS